MLFLPISFCQKFTKLNCNNREKLHNLLSYKKLSSKMLMKLTKGFCQKCQPPCINCTGINTCIICKGCPRSRKCHIHCSFDKCYSDFTIKLISNNYLLICLYSVIVLFHLKKCFILLITSSFCKRFSWLQKKKIVQRIQNSHKEIKENSTLDTGIPF